MGDVGAMLCQMEMRREFTKLRTDPSVKIPEGKGLTTKITETTERGGHARMEDG